MGGYSDFVSRKNIAIENDDGAVIGTYVQNPTATQFWETLCVFSEDMRWRGVAFRSKADGKIVTQVADAPDFVTMKPFAELDNLSTFHVAPTDNPFYKVYTVEATQGTGPNERVLSVVDGTPGQPAGIRTIGWTGDEGQKWAPKGSA